MRRLAKSLLPEFALRVARRIAGRSGHQHEQNSPARLPEWEYLPNGWREESAHSQGWNVPSVAETQSGKWRAFLASIEGPGPLGVSHEGPPDLGRESQWAHNLIMSYAYVLALASRNRDIVSILDWGGGVGHYYPISKALLPGVALEYFSSDVPSLNAAGRKLQPDAHFFDNDDCFSRRYDLVMAGSSLWYVHDWKSAASRLANSSAAYLYVTRMMFVKSTPSYVAVQRPTSYGYLTDYQFWVLNQDELVGHIERSGMKLVREFFFGAGPELPGAPEQGTFRGFLFKREQPAS